MVSSVPILTKHIMVVINTKLCVLKEQNNTKHGKHIAVLKTTDISVGALFVIHLHPIIFLH